MSGPHPSCADYHLRSHQPGGIRLQTHLPVLGLVDPLRIGPSKVTFTVEGGDGSTELGHGVEVCGEIIQHGDDVGGERCSLRPLFGNPVDLQGWKILPEFREQSRGSRPPGSKPGGLQMHYSWVQGLHINATSHQWR